MPKKKASITVTYFAQDTLTGLGKTGDAGNHALAVIKDGTRDACANSASEVDGTNHPGLYKVVITGDENDGAMMCLHGKSSTSNVVIYPVFWTNEVNAVQINDSETAAENVETNIGYLDGAISSVYDAVDDVRLDTGTNGVVVAENAIGAAQIADDAVAEIADAVWDEAAGGHTAAGTFGEAAGYVAETVGDILADTGTDGVKLADDAITAAKFDQSTAFPLTQADTGSTAVARTGADGDTLETLSDQLDAVPTRGSGSVSTTIRITENGLSDGTPVADADVWITSDSAGSTIVAGTLQTNAQGEATFNLDPGSYYVWAQKDGWNWISGQSLTVS